jgi:hypothetical protein
MIGKKNNCELASPTGFELESIKNGDEAEEADVIDISKLKKLEG